MKKNVLTLSITAALVGFGFSGGAQAIGLVNAANAAPVPPGVASALRTSVDGVGQFLYVPYYSVQAGNTTLINLVNTDTANGKAVKVRFRGAGNSDDLFDFQVFLSPGDVWTANVSMNANGVAQLSTADASCTKPSKDGVGGLNSTPFSTVRMNAFRTGDALANETREGYVEIFNMADIPSGTALYTAIKHVNSVAPCASAAAFTALNTDPADTAAANGLGLFAPTTGLMGNWIILNANDAGAWSGQATAIVAVDGANAATSGAIAYFPQTNEGLGLSGTDIAKFTADPWLIAHPTFAMVYDLPDFSIPYTNIAGPAAQVNLLNTAISTRNVINEFLTNSAINSTTDWVLSMPTRRYSVAWDYFATPAARVYNLGVPAFGAGNTAVIDKQVCVTGVTGVSYDQEENTAVDPGASVIISPVLPGQPTSFLVCGEASVLSFNNGEPAQTGLMTTPSGTLQATVARSTIENGYVAGWTNLATPGIANAGLPILGYEAVRATAGAHTFGATLGHRTTRVQN